MIEKTLLPIAEAQARVTGELSQIALEYAAIYGRVVPRRASPASARTPGNHSNG
jgi:hypothetical protein